MGDAAIETYFDRQDVAYTDDAVPALKHVLERYLGFLAEVSRDLARENGHEQVAEEDVLRACDR